jgi:hypothetical protein
LSSGARSRSVSRMVAPRVVAANPVAKPCTARDESARRQIGRHEYNHCCDVHRQGARIAGRRPRKSDKDPTVLRASRRHSVCGEDHGDHERRQAEVVWYSWKAASAPPSRREGHRREHGEGRRGVHDSPRCDEQDAVKSILMGTFCVAAAIGGLYAIS